MSWRDIRLLYLRELRSALRERSIVVNSILVPLVLYPGLLWAFLSGSTLIQGLSEDTTSRVAIYALPAEHAALGDSLSNLEGVEVLSAPPPEETVESAVREGSIDAALWFAPAGEEAAALEANFVAHVTFDQSEERSRRAKQRVTDALDRYRLSWLERQSTALGISQEDLAQFEVERENLAESSGVIALLLPLLLVIMVAVGCFYPAIDATAGERERSTWETLMSAAASRSSILVAKYLYVATMGVVAGLLNVVAMVITVTAILVPWLNESPGTLESAVPGLAVPVMALGTTAVALLFAALMMLLASFARTFKDGQAMITPVYYLALLPVFFVAEPDIGLDAQIAVIPIANVMIMMREALQGTFQWIYIGESLLIVAGLVVLTLGLARWVLQFEDLLIGSYDGNLWTFIRERLAGRRAGRGSAA